MTAFTETVLTCDRETREPVDGIRTVCGTPYTSRKGITDARWDARKAGWTHAGTNADYCPEHSYGRGKEHT